MDFKKVLVVSVASMLMAASVGCTSISEKVGEKAAEKMIEKGTGGKVDIKGENVTIKSENGDAELSVGTAKLPSGFPKDFPIYKGAQVMSSLKTTENGKETMLVNFEAEDKFADVVAYYKEAVAEEGYEIGSSFEVENMVTLGLKKDGEDAGSVIVTGEDGGKTTIAISVINKVAK